MTGSSARAAVLDSNGTATTAPRTAETRVRLLIIRISDPSACPPDPTGPRTGVGGRRRLPVFPILWLGSGSVHHRIYAPSERGMEDRPGERWGGTVPVPLARRRRTGQGVAVPIPSSVVRGWRRILGTPVGASRDDRPSSSNFSESAQRMHA
ncbi:hypothetical protein MN0502_22570 [Arthrobacter sp. MN05-02]|nr:hypothetical protein MN0502_22570 [Arthrobacter sp. MN05-02]